MSFRVSGLGFRLSSYHFGFEFFVLRPRGLTGGSASSKCVEGFKGVHRGLSGLIDVFGSKGSGGYN